MTESEKATEVNENPEANAPNEPKRFATLRTKLGRKNVRQGLRVSAAVLAAVVIFVAGVGIGDGRLYVGMFSKTETGLPAELNYASVNQIYQLIRSQYNGKLTTTQLLNGIKAGLTNSLNDPYSEYFTPSQASDFNEQLQGSFSGVGAELGENNADVLEIIAPVSGSPAAKAGLQAQDLITAINGKTTNGMSIDAAVAAIRGPEGSKVTLTITRGSKQNIEMTITRANVVVPSVTSSIIDNGKIGYMQISQFSDDTAGLAQEAAQNFVNKKVQGVVLDMRDNPGGLVDAAVDVSSLWLPNNTMILQEKRGSSVVQTYKSNGNDILQGIPTVVLVNGGTASAAEITTGALHDNKAATVVGQKTYGKGVVQQLNTLPGGAELKVTVASWYRPDGQNINHKGITPDEIVAPAAGDSIGGNDAQLTAAITALGK